MKLSASFLTIGTLLPALWFSVNPAMTQFLPTDSNGNLVEYSVTRPDNLGVQQKLVFNAAAQTSLSKVVRGAPKL